MSCGEPQRRAFIWQGTRYESLAQFARRWGLSPQTVAARLKLGITDERLTLRRLRANSSIRLADLAAQPSRPSGKSGHGGEGALAGGSLPTPQAAGLLRKRAVTGERALLSGDIRATLTARRNR